MKALCICFLGLLAMPASGEVEGPMAKVIELITGLQAKVTHEGEKAQQVYDEFANWCEDESKKLTREIKTGKQETIDIQAVIDDEKALIASLNAKVEELSSVISKSEKNLKSARELRAQEAKDFVTERDELVVMIDQVNRAMDILQKELSSGTSFVQMRNAQDLTQVLGVLVDSATISGADWGQLSALLQTTQQDGDQDSTDQFDQDARTQDTENPKEQGGTIIKTLEGLVEKAQSQLQKAQGKESTAIQNFKVLEITLSDKIKYSTQDMGKAKSRIAGSKEQLAGAEGELAVVSKEFKEDTVAKQKLHSDCLTKSADFETATQDRTDELKALAAAKTALMKASQDDSFVQSDAFFQVQSVQGISDAPAESQGVYAATRLVRNLAMRDKSAALMQLASRMAALTEDANDAQSSDPFAKVKGLVSDMISRLEAEASEDATKKDYCDRELSHTNEKKQERSTSVKELSTKIDKKMSRATKLKGQVRVLQRELAELAASQSEMNKLREKEHGNFVENKADIEKGLEGVKVAIRVLREFYSKGDDEKKKRGSSSSSGASTAILGMLEVIESDFSKSMAELITEEDQAQRSYEKETQENEIEKSTKEQAVKLKSKETAQIDKDVAEAKNDRSGEQAELDAVVQYLTKIEEACIAKPETYEERKKKREADIAGLKEALKVLSQESFLQSRSTQAFLRSRSAVKPTIGTMA